MSIPLTAREPLEFTPTATFLNEKLRNAGFKIFIRVPTMLERDRYGAALVRAGVVFYTQKQIRDMTLAGVQEHYPDDQHDEIVSLLEEFWQVADEERRVQALQGEKLIELYEAAKAKKKQPNQKIVQAELAKITPSQVMDKRRRIRALGYASEVGARNLSVRDALAALTEADSKRDYMNIQTFVIGWKGLPAEPDPPGPQGLLVHEAEYLRLQIGEDAWSELSDKITSLQELSEDEVKNSDSLLENTSDATGSTPSEPSSASSDTGSSTDVNTSPTRANGSPRTTESSAKSTKK